jgi:hypothetical protein
MVVFVGDFSEEDSSELMEVVQLELPCGGGEAAVDVGDAFSAHPVLADGGGFVDFVEFLGPLDGGKMSSNQGIGL